MAAGVCSPSTFADIHPSIIQTHILPRLDGPSLSTAATASSCLHDLCTDDDLWFNLCKSTWPSVTEPRVNDVVSTFPAGHRSFFQDSFPALITEENPRRSCSNRQPECPTSPSELISVVDIRYLNDVVYSRVKFTDTSPGFLSPVLCIVLNEDPDCNRTVPGIYRPIELKVDDDAVISHIKESVSLNWILIDPTWKRAGNLSSIKPVVVKRHWMTNDVHLRYVTVLPGRDPNDMVECRIKVTCAVGGVGLHVREVMLQMRDLDYRVLSGKDFLVVTRRAIWEENNVRRRKVGNGEEGEKRYKKLKEMRKENVERVKKEEKRMELAMKVNYIVIVVSFVYSVYLGSLLL